MMIYKKGLTMLKNLARLEHIVEDKAVQLFCDHDTPLEIIKDALFQFGKFIGRIEDQVKEQQAKAKADEEEKLQKVSKEQEVKIE